MSSPATGRTGGGDGSESNAGTPSRTDWRRPTAFYDHRVKWAVYLLIAVFFLWSAWGLRIPPSRIILGFEQGADLLSRMFPPDFSPARREMIVSGLIETLAMSVVATIVGVLVSLPIAFLAARNVSPLLTYLVGRGAITFSRSFHSLIFAIVAVKAFGFGPFAGVVTLVFATVGFFAKLLAEDLEDIDEGQIDAIRATGASRLQVLHYGVVPQVLPRIVGLTVYRWDINLRAASIIGIVGAGGIGQTLLTSFGRYDYSFSIAIIISIVAIVLAGEFVSAYIRGKIQ